MTWLCAWDLCMILAMSWEIQHQTSFLSKNALCIPIKRHNLSGRSSQYVPVNEQTTSVRLTAHHGTVGIPSSYTQFSYTQQDSPWIEGASWLSLIPFSLIAKYIIFRIFHFVSWLSSSPFHHSKSWLQKQINEVLLEPNRATKHAFQPMRHPVRHSTNANNS
jgi:hypothetical protein